MSDRLIDNKELMKEWNFEKNTELDPTKLKIGSGKKVWWKCSYYGQSYSRKVYQQVARKGKCPICKNKKI